MENKIFTKEKLQEMYPDIFREESKDNYSNCKASRIIYNEGIGYAVDGYCSYNVFRDPVTRALWKNARIALQELEEYVIENSEVDEE